jgi:DNA-binding transcriptional LysR family regulator
VTQLVRALERELGVTLFHRSSQGLSLTADGERYYEVSSKLALELDAVEQRLGPRGTQPRGTIAVGMQTTLGQNCIMPRIGRFLAQYPEVDLVIRPVVGIGEMQEKKLDLVVLAGWPPERDWVVRPLAQTRLVVCAAPEYWARAGTPREPQDLSDHPCLVLRSTGGTLLDRWTFQRQSQQRVVDVKTRIFSDDRGWLAEAACAGVGIVRLTDIALNRYLASGLLVPVLCDWHALEAPTIFAAYAPVQRRSRLVRVFVDFVIGLFAEIDPDRISQPGASTRRVPKPDWFGRAHGRHSQYARNKARAGMR